MLSTLDFGPGGPVRVLAQVVTLCSWARHFPLTQSALSIQVY